MPLTVGKISNIRIFSSSKSLFYFCHYYEYLLLLLLLLLLSVLLFAVKQTMQGKVQKLMTCKLLVQSEITIVQS